MKFPLLLTALTLGTATLAPAQTAEPNHAQTSAHGAGAIDANGKIQSPDGIARAREATVYIKDGKVTHVNSELKLSEGLTVKPSGEVTLADGKTIKLEEGQMVTLDGKMTMAPIGLGSTAPGSTGTQPPDSSKTKFGNGAAPIPGK